MANNKFKPGFLMVLLLLVVFTSCSQYQKLLKNDDVVLKKDKSIEYYNKGEYEKTITLITSIMPAFRGTSFAEELNYYYAMAHYKQRDYIMAAHYFKTFTQGFPRSEHVEEFLYLSAYCRYLLSPRPSLDQTETQEAINEFQAFINRFPQSQRVEESNNRIDELRLKLEQKAFDSALMYFNIRDYMAAVTSFSNVINAFPDTDYREEALYYIIRSHFLYAENSIENKQLERYQKVVPAYSRLVNRYPESRFKDEADQVLAAAQQQIARLEQLADTRNEIQ